MNKLSSTIISLAVLAGIGGGIMYTVALCNGVKAQSLVNQEAFKKSDFSLSVTSAEDDASKSIKISMVDCNISIIDSDDGKLAISYTGITSYSEIDKDSIYEIHEEAFRFNNLGLFMDSISFGNILDQAINRSDSSLTISIPAWYDRDLKISTINGNITSTAKNLGSNTKLSSINGNMKVKTVESIGNLSISTTNGDIDVDLGGTSPDVSAREVSLGTTNGYIHATVKGSYKYTVKTVNGDKVIPTNHPDSHLTLIAKTINGDIEITEIA